MQYFTIALNIIKNITWETNAKNCELYTIFYDINIIKLKAKFILLNILSAQLQPNGDR